MTFFLGNISIPATTKYVEKISDTVTSFSVAENRKTRNGDSKVVYHRISIFGKRGKNLQKWLTTGRPMLVVGREDAGAYINKEGKAVPYLQMVNASIQFATGANKEDDPTDEIPVDEIPVDEVVEEEDGGPF